VQKRQFTLEEKQTILHELAVAIKDGLRSFNDCCLKHGVSLRHIELFSADKGCDAAIDEIETAKQQLASKYVEEGRAFLDDTDATKRHAAASVQKAKYQMDLRFKLAEALDPRNWSSLKDEIKSIQSELKALRTIVERGK
jgi:hypothetical protein